MPVFTLCIFLLVSPAFASAAPAANDGPEATLRALVKANAEKDLHAMAQLVAQDGNMLGYSIAGRKYVGWSPLAAELRQEFENVSRLEIPIRELKVWRRGDLAWFAMELDYIRYVSHVSSGRMIIPLRETGVLERRNGTWTLVVWHESMRTPGSDMGIPEARALLTANSGADQVTVDLSGEWEINEEDKSYKATLDHSGNGTYSWQNGRITTTAFSDRKWQGTWHQAGNDREGGFDILLSEDGKEAKGVWWYSRVGDKQNIPPRQWGGSYLWKRLTPVPGPAH